MIEQITLDNVLPRVFADEGLTPRIAASQVWLKQLAFVRGERYLVDAESGTGKSSLCSYLYGARRDYSGRIAFDGTDCATFSIDRWSSLRCRSLAYLPQQLSIFPELTVMENIEIKNRLTTCKSRSEIVAMLERLEIADKQSVKARYLSIGQQQRVAIMRVLCQPFDFLLLDEPVSHLDARNNVNVAAMIAEAVELQGAGLIVTSVGNHLYVPGFKELKM